MVKLAIPTRDGRVDNHFGHCAYYSVLTVSDDGKLGTVERVDSPQGCGCKSNMAQVLQAKGVTLMLAGNMGEGALKKLTEHGIAVIRGCSGTLEEVLDAYVKGELKDSAEACDHHDCPSGGNERVIFKIDSKL